MSKKEINNIRLETEVEEDGSCICFIYQDDELVCEVEADNESELRHEVHVELASLL